MELKLVKGEIIYWNVFLPITIFFETDCRVSEIVLRMGFIMSSLKIFIFIKNLEPVHHVQDVTYYQH